MPPITIVFVIIYNCICHYPPQHLSLEYRLAWFVNDFCFRRCFEARCDDGDYHEEEENFYCDDYYYHDNDDDDKDENDQKEMMSV